MIFILNILWFVLGGFTALATASNEMQIEETEIHEVTQAAQAATKVFFPRAENRKAVFGFDANDRLEAAVLKSPVKLYTIDDAAMLAYQPGQPVSQLLKSTGQWFVPVAIGGTNRAMIAVIATGDGKWTGSTFGLAPLARKWQNIESWWPSAEKFTPRLIILPVAQGYFFTIPQTEPGNLTAMVDLPATHIDSTAVPKPPLAAAESKLTGIRDALKQAKNEPDHQ